MSYAQSVAVAYDTFAQTACKCFSRKELLRLFQRFEHATHINFKDQVERVGPLLVCKEDEIE